MNNEVKGQVLKSVTAVICAAAVCISTGSVVDKICKSNLEISALTSGRGLGAMSDLESDFFSDGDGNSQTETETGTVSESTDTAQPSEDQPQAGENTQTPQENTAKPNNSGTAAKSDVPSTTAEILNYCNTALNKVKSSKAGFTKRNTMNVKGEATGLFDKVKGLVTKDESKTVKKGEDSNDVFPAAGFAWSSKLRESDIKSANIKVNGQYYEILIKLGNENNPAKGESSSYGRVMSVIDANDAKDMLPGIKSVNMAYHDGYIYAKIDSKSGNVVKAEFSASADVAVKVAILGDISAKDIVSTETFTNFVW